ncbi:hypothetical protein IFM89_013457 [Coptis chinensis]|uniref:valine--tRNA ligase n=1 Tax=Coptis chinensis TaxID=261450 RepID=A0A835HKZ3_9MAGN|nr:hypothetical protein IFM89_013457 [Coptis chinensis]
MTESHMNLVDGIVKSLRSLRPQLSPNERHQRQPAFAVCRTDKSEFIKTQELEISTFASLSSLEVLGEYDTRLSECGCSKVENEDITAYLELRGALNTEAELEKLRKRRGELQKQHDNLKQIMSVAGYKQKVAEHRQNEDVAKLEKLMRELNVIEETTSNLERAIAGGRYSHHDKRSKLPGWILSHFRDAHLNLSTYKALHIAREFLRKMAQPYDKAGSSGKKTVLSQEDLEKLGDRDPSDMLF